MNKIAHVIAYIFITLIFIACGNPTKKSNEITTEMINNPVTANGKTDMSDLPKIQFDEQKHDFGILLQGEKVSYTFTFKNIGRKDLIIKDATASCGCTIPRFPKEPIKSGDTGEIEVVFNSSNRSGRQIKTVTVWSNSQPNKTQLEIISEIVVPNP